MRTTFRINVALFEEKVEREGYFLRWVVLPSPKIVITLTGLIVYHSES